MPSFEKHCADCVNELGKPYEAVHLWLDELFKRFGPAHRAIRHNSKGIEKVRRHWGDEAAKAAEIHIIADEGRVPEVNDIFKFRLAIKSEIMDAFLQEYRGY